MGINATIYVFKCFVTSYLKFLANTLCFHLPQMCQ